ncbi:MAG TPA: oligosaccharide flippase family protein, partial [Gemmataceae bacterium]
MTPLDSQLDPPADAIAVADAAPAAADDQAGGVRRVAARGAAWTVTGFAGRLVLRFGFNLLLTRLVAPKVFGVMALINLLVYSLHMFSDLGVSQCVVHHDRGDDPKFLNTAWTVQIVRGFILWLMTAAVAAPAAWFYGEPTLAWLVPVAGLTALFDGFQSTALHTLNRRLDRKRLMFWDLIPYATVTAVAVAVIAGVAHRHPGGQDDPEVQHAQVVTLVWAQVAVVVLQMAASYRLIRGRRHRLTLEPAAARELLHFGGWVFVSTAAGFLAAQADQLVIGKVSLDTLGVYRVASQTAALPAQFVAALCAQLVFPLYSRLLRDGNGHGAGIGGVHRTVGVVAGWLVTGLVVAGPTFIDCLYRGRYQEAGGYVQFLAMAVWFTMLQSTGEAVLLARGQARLMAYGQVLKLAALVPLMAIGYQWGGLIGLVIGYAAAEALRYAAIAAAVRSLGQRLVWGDMALTVLVAATAGGFVWAGPELWGAA